MHIGNIGAKGGRMSKTRLEGIICRACLPGKSIFEYVLSFNVEAPGKETSSVGMREDVNT